MLDIGLDRREHVSKTLRTMTIERRGARRKRHFQSVQRHAESLHLTDDLGLGAHRTAARLRRRRGLQPIRDRQRAEVAELARDGGRELDAALLRAGRGEHEIVDRTRPHVGHDLRKRIGSIVVRPAALAPDCWISGCSENCNVVPATGFALIRLIDVDDSSLLRPAIEASTCARCISGRTEVAPAVEAPVTTPGGVILRLAAKRAASAVLAANPLLPFAMPASTGEVASLVASASSSISWRRR